MNKKKFDVGALLGIFGLSIGIFALIIAIYGYAPSAYKTKSELKELIIEAKDLEKRIKKYSEFLETVKSCNEKYLDLSNQQNRILVQIELLKDQILLENKTRTYLDTTIFNDPVDDAQEKKILESIYTSKNNKNGKEYLFSIIKNSKNKYIRGEALDKFNEYVDDNDIDALVNIYINVYTARPNSNDLDYMIEQQIVKMLNEKNAPRIIISILKYMEGNDAAAAYLIRVIYNEHWPIKRVRITPIPQNLYEKLPVLQTYAVEKKLKRCQEVIDRIIERERRWKLEKEIKKNIK
jgi:hypothetical protein